MCKSPFRSSWVVLGAVAAAIIGGPAALAEGTLWDEGVLVLTFDDWSSIRAVSADNDGNYIYTVSGGNPDGYRFARYLPDGSMDHIYASGIDFRTLFTNNNRELFAKGFVWYDQPAQVFSLSIDGEATFLYTLNLGHAHASAGFNADDTEIYTRDGTTMRRFDAADGSYLGSFTLDGMSAEELEFPADFQMETNLAGRIFTYAVGVVSEWDLDGQRIGTCTIPIDTPDGFETTWSFAVGGDDRVYLLNDDTERWEVYDIGIAAECGGDVDGDGDTDLNDLAALLAAYGSQTGDPSYDPNADFDADGEIGLADLGLLLGDYGCGT
jgi:hypothetical protein